MVPTCHADAVRGCPHCNDREMWRQGEDLLEGPFVSETRITTPSPSAFRGKATIHHRLYAWGERQRSRSRFTPRADRKSTRLNSSHQIISYAVFSLKKKTHDRHTRTT